MSRPRPSRSSRSFGPMVRINGRIRAREVRVVDDQGNQIGILQLGEAIQMARSQGLDLVEIAANARPPVCRLVEYGKWRYENRKKDKENKRNQHANKVKEIQLRPNIDPHDFQTKLNHAVGFLCDDMKLKISLRYRGREMAHKELGFQLVERFLKELNAFGHPDAAPKLAGRSLNVMVSPLPRNKRAPNPFQDMKASEDAGAESPQTSESAESSEPQEEAEKEGFVNNPFSSLNSG